MKAKVTKQNNIYWIEFNTPLKKNKSQGSATIRKIKPKSQRGKPKAVLFSSYNLRTAGKKVKKTSAFKVITLQNVIMNLPKIRLILVSLGKMFSEESKDLKDK